MNLFLPRSAPQPPGFLRRGLHVALATLVSAFLFSLRSHGQAASDGIWDPSTEPVEVDIILLYTPRARAAQGDEEALRRSIRAVIDSANYSFARSLIGVRLNPVWIGLHSTWVESGDMLTEHNAMYSDSRIATLRSDYKADFVYLVIESDANFYDGVATGLNDLQGQPNRCMSVMRRTIFAGSPRWTEHAGLGLIHETGHFLGAGHDVEHGYPTPFQSIRALFPYSNGRRFEVGGVLYRTAMAYDPGIQLNLFSNPNLNFAGVPLGIPAGQPGEADNAQTLNRAAPIVAAYRTALSRIGFAKSSLSVAEGEGSVTVPLLRTGDLNSSTRVTVTFDNTSPARVGQDFTRPVSTFVTFGTNQATAELVIPILEDDLLEGDETLRIGLSTVQGNHGLNADSACTITIRDNEPAISLSQPSVSLAENGGIAEVTVEFTGHLAEGGTHEVDLAIGREGDTATPGTDFEVTPARLTFTAAQRRQTLQIRSLPDSFPETDEFARIGLGNAELRVEILDDSRPGSLLPVAAPNGTVIALRALPSGGVLLAGDFTQVGGVRRTGLARLRADGSLSAEFVPPELVSAPFELPEIPPTKILCVTPLASGHWMAGGFIGLADGTPARNLVRIKPDGRLDTTFQHPGFDGAVWTVVEQPDGRLLVGGAFEHVGDRPVQGLARLNADGSLDPTFRLEPGVQGTAVAVSGIGLVGDGRLLVGGSFITHYNNSAATNLFRLNSDGSLDTTFPLLKTGAKTAVLSVSALPDGRAYAGGFFERVGGRSIRRLVRLSPDGSIDPTFTAPQPNGEIIHLQPLPNGQLLVAGGFTVIAGANRRFVALLNEDGTVDESFDLGRGAGDHVWAVAAGGDGSLYLGGTLQSFNGQPAPYLARLRLPQIAGAFTDVNTDATGRFHAHVLGLPGARYEIESTTDLKAWRPAGDVWVDAPDHSAVFSALAAGDTQLFRIKTPSP
ncbi:MAG: hypothetical protein KF791_19255 [Verrucomicrobiae bacterium]|nr:hypothetical protein [Verrucomicrobiae bacterium]